MAKVKNAACTQGCTCPCCSADCPYCTVAAMIDLLVAKGVCADAAAKVAADFVNARCAG